MSFPTCLGGLANFEALVEIVDDVVDVFDADGNAD